MSPALSSGLPAAGTGRRSGRAWSAWYEAARGRSSQAVPVSRLAQIPCQVMNRRIGGKAVLHMD
jgi:hypothetical protein